MSNTFPHGYALLIGVGESAYPKWSLPVTVKDIQARRLLVIIDSCHAEGMATAKDGQAAMKLPSTFVQTAAGETPLG